LNIFLALTIGVVLDHSGKISFADLTAAFIQSDVPETTLAVSSPEAGLKTGVDESPEKLALFPLIKWSINFIITPKKIIKLFKIDL
jgi:hypothetical protein